MKIKHYLLAALAGILLCATSCSHENNDFNNIYVDFVTLVSSTAEGSTLEYQPANDGAAVTLHTDQSLVSFGYEVGTRLVISYRPEMGLHGVSGNIVVFEAVTAEGKGNMAPATTAEETNNWASNTVSLTGIQRSGKYINFQLTAQCNPETKQLKFVLDETTAGNETPDYYIIFTDLSATAIGDYVYYGSWDISDIWNLPSCQGVRVHYKDASQGDQIIEIKKD